MPGKTARCHGMDANTAKRKVLSLSDLRPVGMKIYRN